MGSTRLEAFSDGVLAIPVASSPGNLT